MYWRDIKTFPIPYGVIVYNKSSRMLPVEGFLSTINLADWKSSVYGRLGHHSWLQKSYRDKWKVSRGQLLMTAGWNRVFMCRRCFINKPYTIYLGFPRVVNLKWGPCSGYIRSCNPYWVQEYNTNMSGGDEKFSGTGTLHRRCNLSTLMYCQWMYQSMLGLFI